ncbi:hemolysin family protein [Pendulispora albinea]|uniref:Hemolysin family protein n=1 Tax=Pendulispora albinea TaxID=2741071 RepID=A0ABZ2LT79_9BACT
MIGLLLVALFIFLNGFFVAAEFAFVKMHATQLHPRVKRGEKRAIFAQRIIERLDRYLSVTQFGVTLASLGLGWIGEPAIERLVVSWTGNLFEGELAKALHVVAVIIAFGMLTFSHVLLGELVPKLIAIQRSEATALFSATPLHVMYLTFRPLLWILEHASALILRFMGLSADAASEGTLSEEQILGILAANTARSPMGKKKGELLERVIRFSQRTARHAMVPRVDVASLPIDTPREEALKFIRAQQYSRLILTKDRSLDNVVGYLYVKDFLFEDGAAAGDLRNLRRDAIFVPETQGLHDVMQRLQEAQIPIAVVVDEYGGTSGIVTMEDLLEEIVGEIRDELDEEPAALVKVPGDEQAWEVDARLKMDDLRAIGVQVESEDAAEPIGAVLLEKLGHLPRKGDSAAIAGNAVGIVSALSRRRITRVRIRIAPQPAAA